MLTDHGVAVIPELLTNSFPLLALMLLLADWRTDNARLHTLTGPLTAILIALYFLINGYLLAALVCLCLGLFATGLGLRLEWRLVILSGVFLWALFGGYAPVLRDPPDLEEADIMPFVLGALSLLCRDMVDTPGGLAPRLLVLVTALFWLLYGLQSGLYAFAVFQTVVIIRLVLMLFANHEDALERRLERLFF